MAIDIAQIHPMLVHFPLALMPVALAYQALTIKRRASLSTPGLLSNTNLSLLVLAAIGGSLAAIFGDIAFEAALKKGFSVAQLEGHEELGTATAVVLVGLAIVQSFFFWRGKASRRLDWTLFGFSVVTLGLLLTTAWFGGHLVYDLGVNVAVGT